MLRLCKAVGLKSKAKLAIAGAVLPFHHEKDTVPELARFRFQVGC
jgi:hypothetical protein